MKFMFHPVKANTYHMATFLIIILQDFFPCFPLDGFAVYMNNTRLFSSIYTGPVWKLVVLTNLIVVSRDGKQHGAKTGAASINKTTCLVAKQTNTHVTRTPCQ